MGWRLLAVILLLAVGAASLSYAFVSLFSSDPGWTEIQSESREINVSDDFVLLYDVGRSGSSSTVERKALTTLYTQATAKAWQLFNNDETTDGVPNVRYLNDHPNEIVTVDAALYKAFEQVAASGSRALYLAPIAEVYDNLFLCADDLLTADFDPLLNPALSEFFAEVAAFARDASAIDLELMDDHQVRLNVSEAYLAYAAEEEITDFIDFHWMRNAFIIDYLADELIAHNYTLGTLSSYDGFCRALGSHPGTTYSLNLFDLQAGTVLQAAVMQYEGPQSTVSLRSYPVVNYDSRRFYIRQDGQIRTAYLDPADGLTRTALSGLVAYAADSGCAEILLQVAPVFIAENLDEEALLALAQAGIQTIHAQNRVLRYTDPTLSLTDFYEGADGSYRGELMEP